MDTQYKAPLELMYGQRVLFPLSTSIELSEMANTKIAVAIAVLFMYRVVKEF